MPFPTRALILASAALFVAGSAWADNLTLTIGQVRRASAAGTVANVVVGDPAVADVTVIDQHSVVILGKGLGSTGILATDRAGHVLIDDQITIAGASEGGRVTVYRGAKGSDYACASRCETRDGTEGAAASADSSPAAPTPHVIAPPVTVTQSHP